jgi:ABC-type uncharacterized transport system ATPase subunit
MTQAAVTMTSIHKSFGSVVANDGVSLEIKEGEVCAIVGENGAGKTTLMNILSGLLQPDRGSIEIYKGLCRFKRSADAIRAGIGMVHQHFKLVSSFTVLENIILGHEPTEKGFISYKKARDKIQEIVERFAFQLLVDEPVDSLSASQKQQVEILRLIYHEAQILVFDEPTSMLTPIEKERFFRGIELFRKQGKTVILISHKISDLIDIADKMYVMRRGKVIETYEKADFDIEKISSAIVGDGEIAVTNISKSISDRDSVPLLKVHLSLQRGQRGRGRVAFSIFPGEVFGITGVAGNGQRELVDALFGIRHDYIGRITWKGANLKGSTTEQIRRLGISYLPEDRKNRGSISLFTLAENRILGYHKTETFVRKRRFDFSTICKDTRQLLDKYHIMAPDELSKAEYLSGGNLQKLLLARELEGFPELIILEQPTQGLDIRATREFYEILLRRKEKGMAILLISYDLDEVLEISDRIGVLYDYSLVYEVEKEKATRSSVGMHMTRGNF